jgi:hypothetical protein
MIGIVKLALQRPYTFTVMALLITIFGGAAAHAWQGSVMPIGDPTPFGSVAARRVVA